ncbi:hypothetical protein [Tranquillimonas rosea]|uniref:hypothetical protein n=1 Tax=Tranquillimonas rosea TaxID=641238 RepID=UPI003BAC55D9
MSPRVEAVAFMVWRHCEPIGWDCTLAEAAAAIGETTRAVGHACKEKGWTHRFRTSATDYRAPLAVLEAS